MLSLARDEKKEGSRPSCRPGEGGEGGKKGQSTGRAKKGGFYSRELIRRGRGPFFYWGEKGIKAIYPDERAGPPS